MRRWVVYPPLYAAQPGRGPEINFVWQGGEPLLAGLRFYQEGAGAAAALCPAGVTISSNSHPTNATLINDALIAACSGNITSRSASVWKAVKRCKTTIVRINAARPAAGGAARHRFCCTGIRWNFNLLVLVHDEMTRHAASIYDHIVSLGAR